MARSTADDTHGRTLLNSARDTCVYRMYVNDPMSSLMRCGVRLGATAVNSARWNSRVNQSSEKWYMGSTWLSDDTQKYRDAARVAMALYSDRVTCRRVCRRAAAVGRGFGVLCRGARVEGKDIHGGDTSKTVNQKITKKIRHLPSPTRAHGYT